MREYEKNLFRLKESPQNFESIYQIIMANDSVACEFVESGQIVKWTYHDYHIKILKAASKLSKICAKIEKDSYVGLKMPNSPLWPVMFWAILMSGYKPLLLDAAEGEKGTVHLMRQAGAKMLLTAVFDFEDEDPAGFVPRWSNEYALCTSGTTSNGKVYFYTGDAVCYQIFNTWELIIENDRIRPLKTDKILAFLPFHHIFGFIGTYIWFSFYGAAFVYPKVRGPETILEACRNHGVTHILTVPILPNNLIKSIQKKLNRRPKREQLAVYVMMKLSLLLQRFNPELGLKAAAQMFKGLLAQIMGDQIKVIICGGSYTSSKTLRMMNALGYYTVCGYGMTEVGITSCESSKALNRRVIGSIGKPLKYCEYKIDGDGRAGSLYIRGKGIHSGRLIEGAPCPVDIDSAGWLNSEDIGRYAKGTYWIEGRIKEIIINESGENIYPDELEGYFDALPLQNQICVLGTKKDANYEYITLVICIDNTDMNREAYDKLRNAINAINNTLPIMKKINKVYLTTEPLPTVNGIKVKRKHLRKLIETKKIDLVELALRNFGYEIIQSVKARGKKNIEHEIYANEYQMIKTDIKKIFSEVLDLPEVKIGDNAHFINDLGGDSLSSVSLLAKVEEKYKIEIADAEYYCCLDVNSLSDLVLKKRNDCNGYGQIAAVSKKVSLDSLLSLENLRSIGNLLANKSFQRKLALPVSNAVIQLKKRLPR
jgi:acyl carrier protein